MGKLLLPLLPSSTQKGKNEENSFRIHFDPIAAAAEEEEEGNERALIIITVEEKEPRSGA